MTTETKFTPGPWVIGANSCDEQAIIAKQSGRAVAYAAWDGGSGCHLEFLNKHDEALATAAPELYEAAEAALADARFDDGQRVSITAEAMRDIRAALSKARGEA